MKNDICGPKLSFSDCELEILRNAVDKAEKRLAVEKVRSPNVKEIISLVEIFLKNKKLVCYGGTAINNILPKKDQFYNYSEEIPDYDFFSPDALNDAKELADIYFKEGFTEVEAKAGVHHGTYKVFVDFIPVADITQLSPPIFKTFKKNAVQVNNILYTPPDALRMFMYLELSRPLGDVTRWEKVMKRISLLNKNYPLTSSNCNIDSFQRIFEGKEDYTNIYNITKDTIIDHNYIFFGGYASYLYSRYMPKHIQKKFIKHPDFDVLAKDPKKAAEQIKSRLINDGIKNVKIKKHDAVGDHSVLLLPIHYEVIVGKDTIAMIYQPLNCHSYNQINISGKKIKVATIDTMLSFYLAFIYANRDYYDVNRILCMSKYLFQVQQHNRLAQKGLLKRFSIECYGDVISFDEMRLEKSRQFKELKNKPNSKQYESLFLKYRPEDEKKRKNKNVNKKTKKNKVIKNKTRKNKNILSGIFKIKI